jgi:primosomal protein N'
MPVRMILKCRSCGFEMDAERSDSSIPEACPSCGARELEFQVSLEIARVEEEAGVEPLLSEAFIKQVSRGEYVIDTPADDVAIAELEPGVYEIIIRTSRSSSRSR